jgi:hypothetical protein
LDVKSVRLKTSPKGEKRIRDEDPSEYKNLVSRWRQWQAVRNESIHLALLIFDRIAGVA